MSATGLPSSAARRGWLAWRWLALRRATQLALLALFLTGPWLGVWIIKGDINHSLTLGVLPLTDPLVFLQTLAAGHAPARNALVGFLVVVAFYALVGGRVFCSWVCPMNLVTDAAHALRSPLGIRGGVRISRTARYWFVGSILVAAAATGTLAWELVNPVSMLHRGLVFGMGGAWVAVLAVFLLDLFIMERGWCGRFCPVGACYGIIGRASVVRITARRRQDCNDCGDCFTACPEPQVISLPLKGAARGAPPLIASAACTNCARCIDVCARNVFSFTTRFAPSEELK